MEGSARGAPFCKKIFFCFLSKVEKRENREKRREPRLCYSLSSHCKEAFHINTIIIVFYAYCCSCVCEFMNECVYVSFMNVVCSFML
jgi:hypothetical protein